MTGCNLLEILTLIIQLQRPPVFRGYMLTDNTEVFFALLHKLSYISAAFAAILLNHSHLEHILLHSHATLRRRCEQTQCISVENCAVLGIYIMAMASAGDIKALFPLVSIFTVS